MLWSAIPFFETLSQIFMNFASHAPDITAFGRAWILQMAYSTWFWGSLLSDLCCFLCWMAILKHAKLSVAFPLSSICFVTVLLAGWGIFHEPLTLQHWLGTAFIMSGIYLVSKEATK
jgi:drug/metabolite transporter (DMT)-like permease